MIRVIVGTTTQRNEKNYTADTTIRTILEDNAVDYSTAQVMLDGATLQAGTMDKNGKFPKGTVNYEVQKGLERYYKSYAHYAKETHGCLGR